MEKLRIAYYESWIIEYSFDILKYQVSDKLFKILVEEMTIEKRWEFEEQTKDVQIDIVKTLLDMKWHVVEWDL